MNCIQVLYSRANAQRQLLDPIATNSGRKIRLTVRSRTRGARAAGQEDSRTGQEGSKTQGGLDTRNMDQQLDVGEGAGYAVRNI